MHLREQLAKSSVGEAAEFTLSRQSAGKWGKRYRELGVAGLANRSSRPHRLPTQTAPEVVMRVEQMRREGWTARRIAATTGLGSATVSRILSPAEAQ